MKAYSNDLRTKILESAMKRSRMLSDPAGLSQWRQTGRPAAENVLSPAFGVRPLARGVGVGTYVPRCLPCRVKVSSLS